ncbi:MAG TPA: TonB-dependent receptor [Gallionella sp.]|nr:TonB-dependent receptor [Gallionella sp.]
MKGKQLFALSVLTLAVHQAVYAAGGKDESLDEVVVSSTTIDDRFTSRSDKASNTAVISGEKIDKEHPQNLLQVLQAIPGVTADLDSGESVKIKLRGIENQRYMGEKPGVAIVIDGVPVFERTGKVNIDLDNIASIKVIKGGASYLFGEDALSGAVVITTKRGYKNAGLTAAKELGSYGFHKELAKVGFANETASGHIQASRRGAPDFYYQGNYYSNYLDGKLAWYVNDHSDVSFGFETSKRFKDSHGSVTGVTQAAIDPRSVNSSDYARKFNTNLSKVNLTYSNDYAQNANLLLTTYQYKDHTTFLSAPQKYSGTGAVVNDPNAYITGNEYNQVQSGIKGEWRASQDATGWLAGLDLRNNGYWNKTSNLVSYRNAPATPCPVNCAAGAVTGDDFTRERIAGLYGEVTYNATPAWSLTLNGRHDASSLSYSAAPTVTRATSLALGKSFNVNSWRVGTAYDLSQDSNVYGNISTGFRTPTVQQLFTGTVTPNGGKTQDNPNLKPEQALSLEVGARRKAELFGVGVDFSGALFQIDRKDYILAVAGQYSTATNALPERYENIGGVRNRGFELAAKTDARRLFSLDLAYSYIDARFTRYDNFTQTLGNPFGPPAGYTLKSFNNTGKMVPRVPRNQLNTTLNWRPMQDFRAGLEADFKGGYYADEINQEWIGGRTLYNLLMNYEVKNDPSFLRGSKWSFFARIDNVFARNYYVAARGTNDQANPITKVYDKVYNAEDLSLIVGRGRVWSAGISAVF